MNDGSSKGLAVVQTMLLAAIVVCSLMVTCSHDALENRVIELTKAITARSTEGGQPAPRPVAADPVPVKVGDPPVAAPGAGPAPVPAAAAREPGKGSGRFVTGWGGRRAEVTYVTGSLPNGPLTLDEKRVPQADTYTNRRPSSPRSLNYYVSNEGETTTQTDIILEKLITYDKGDLSPSGILAVRWEISPDKLTYIYHLRKGVQFADGRPFSAADVKFSWDVLTNPSVRSEHLRAGIDDIESLETPDADTVVVKYKRLYWAGLFDASFTLKVLNKGWYEAELPRYAKQLDIAKFSTDATSPDFGEVFNKIRIPCPGTGPYYLRSDDDFTKQRIVQVQNPFWWGIQAFGNQYNLLRYETLFIADDVVADQEFRKGAFDVQVVNADRWDDQLSKDPIIDKIAKHFVYDHMRNGYRFVSWNCRQAPFDDARVRKAMTHLFDRDWIVRELQRGRGGIQVCPTKPIYSTYSHDIQPWPFSPERAREILAGAGWTDSNGDGILDKGGKKLEFQLKYPSQIPEFGRISDSFVEAARKAGVLVTPVQLEWSVFIQDYYDRKFDAACLLISYNNPWIDPYPEWHSSQDVPQGGNTPGWHNDEADKLMVEMRGEFDDKKRDAMFHRFNHIFHEEQPMTLLTYTEVDVIANKRFEELTIWKTGMQWHMWWVKPENVLRK